MGGNGADMNRKFSVMTPFNRSQTGMDRMRSKSGSRALEIARNSRIMKSQTGISNTGTNTMLLNALMVPGSKVGHQVVGSQAGTRSHTRSSRHRVSGNQLLLPGQSSGMGNFSRHSRSRTKSRSKSRSRTVPSARSAGRQSRSGGSMMFSRSAPQGSITPSGQVVMTNHGNAMTVRDATYKHQDTKFAKRGLSRCLSIKGAVSRSNSAMMGGAVAPTTVVNRSASGCPSYLRLSNSGQPRQNKFTISGSK